jgi:hypothetical protein
MGRDETIYISSMISTQAHGERILIEAELPLTARLGHASDQVEQIGFDELQLIDEQPGGCADRSQDIAGVGDAPAAADRALPEGGNVVVNSGAAQQHWLGAVSSLS